MFGAGQVGATAAIELAAIERAAVRGWPALETRRIDGWVARSSSGGSVRANTVSALDYVGTDLDASIEAVVSFYRQRGAVARFTITEVDRPEGLDAALAERGWARQGDHVTMAKPIGSLAIPGRSSATTLTVVHHEAPTADWMAVYLGGLTGGRREVAPRLVAGVPKPCTFVSCLRDGRVIASGLSVLDGGLASVQCMATLPTARRLGAARVILAAIEDWAGATGALRLYLQTDSDNAAAISLYVSAGFSVAGRYHVRELPT
ncbi:MAG: GNAT family N-acetyltransferase [Hyphomicrobiaceae bacterium]|nr:GNAT family N-acetyltransferase [Hyphomicrobiaceae bacterium]